MKGDVKRNNFPPTGSEDKKAIMAASPCSVGDDILSRHFKEFLLHHNVVWTSETEKQKGRLVADHSSI
jgi:hypothetical protein